MNIFKSFVAIDFETANANRASACSLGFAKVIDGALVEQRTYMIKPIGGFSPINIRIHGITPDKTKDAPTFEELLPTLQTESEHLPILCFSRFDISVLEALGEYYNLEYSQDLTICDVCDLARSNIPGLPNYRLDSLSRFLNLPEFNHHNAEEDAVQCALVYLAIIQNPQTSYPQTSYLLNESSPESTESWKEDFCHLATEILADNTVTLDEAYELQSLLGNFADKSRLIQSLFGMTSVILEDGRVTKAESDLLCAMLNYAICTIRPEDTKRTNYVDFTYSDTCRLMPEDINIPDGYQPLLKPDIPTKYKERWQFVKQHPFATFASSQITITGTGIKIDRISAEELVTALGATLKTSTPTRTTDFCVVLGSDPELTTTGKCIRARELMEQGSPIRILDEDSFIDLLRSSIVENASTGTTT